MVFKGIYDYWTYLYLFQRASANGGGGSQPYGSPDFWINPLKVSCLAGDQKTGSRRIGAIAKPV